MDNKLIDGIIAVAVAVVGLATVSVIFSQRAQTAPVVTAAGNSFSEIIKAAVGPVS
ncbi:MAG: hypothetical protein KGJ13_06285 [Patescibacteria group bacterium]|nr:hypothetical protein [Patescibacteria group bacterium]